MHGRSKVLTVALLKIQVFWGVMPCVLVNSYRYFEGSQAFTFGVKQSKKKTQITELFRDA